jgi:hypothetical protein
MLSNNLWDSSCVSLAMHQCVLGRGFDTVYACSKTQRLPASDFDEEQFMSRFPHSILLTLAVCFLFGGLASATTYYIAANGSDSNNGTSNTTPWAHAPGMPKCTAACAAKTPAAGDQFIFRGGDTWHFGNSAASPYVGSGGWTWTWSGSSTSPIYIGVDQTWYSGSSWARPVMNSDNALSTSFVKSCSYDDSTANDLWLNQVSYVTVDNFEWPGRCWSSPSSSSAAIFNYQTCHVILSNHYFHGWTAVLGSEDNQMILGNASGSCGLATFNQYSGNVFDGSDSSAGAANSAACAQGFEPGMPCQSGVGIYGEGYDIHDNVFRYMSNMAVVVNLSTYHDNLAEYLYTSYAPAGIAPHSNVINNDAAGASTNIYFYNNTVRHTFVSETIYLYVGSGGAVYLFNNVFFDNLRYDASGDTAPSNCIQMQGAGGTQSIYIYNNTFDNDTDDPTGGGCQISFWGTPANPQAWNGPAYFENNHFIGYTNLAAFNYGARSGGVNLPVHDNGNEIFQPTATARSQGYTQSNNDSPTASTNATVGAGADVTSSCSTFSSDSSLCSGTSLGVTEQSGDGGQMINYPAIAIVTRPSTGAWDVGAYEFGGGQPVNPPTGLQAAVQ